MNKYEFRELMIPPLREIADNLGYPYIEPVFSDSFVIKFNDSESERKDMLEKYITYLKKINAEILVL